MYELFCDPDHDDHRRGPSWSHHDLERASSRVITIAPIPTQDRSPAGKSGVAPTVIVPPGAPPTQLESADLIVGNGAPAAAGESITVQYVLATYSARKVIQSSWTSQPFVFPLGEGRVIPGWDKGVLGMKVGAGASSSSRQALAMAQSRRVRVSQ